MFTKQDVHRKILAPFMTEYLTPIIPPILKLIGYDVEVLPMSDEVSAELGSEVCQQRSLLSGNPHRRRHHQSLEIRQIRPE